VDFNILEKQLKLFIKNMTSLQSAFNLVTIFRRLGLSPVISPGGVVELPENIPSAKLRLLKKLLRRAQFDILLDKKMILAEKVVSLVLEMIHHSQELPAINYSEYISRKLCVSYSLLSKSFSKARGITIEQFIIAQKIEKVKQMLSHQDLTISEIAWKLRYSSPAHLSSQFKRVTGISPSMFKKNHFRK
jgi:AraC-like DNA-binding protein